jgi:hypothetical protein
VSALGHFIEEEGIATVAISLVRPQTENTRPPRALWVPFELGRPFGPPSDPPFQKRVILAALRLFERETGPVVIEDFPEHDPRERPDPGWRPPVGAARLGDASSETIANELGKEIGALETSYHNFAQRRRTLVGLSGLSVPETGRYIATWLRGVTPNSPNLEMSAPLTLRFAVDDLKAYYVEAALAGGGNPSSKQLGDWFWNDTVAGAAIFALRKAYLASPDERLKAIAGLLVPGIRLPPAG